MKVLPEFLSSSASEIMDLRDVEDETELILSFPFSGMSGLVGVMSGLCGRGGDSSRCIFSKSISSCFAPVSPCWPPVSSDTLPTFCWIFLSLFTVTKRNQAVCDKVITASKRTPSEDEWIRSSTNVNSMPCVGICSP